MPTKTSEISEFLVRQTVELDLFAVAINLLIGAALSILLGWVYVRFGRSPSDRRSFAHNLMLITMTTTVVIAVVKSSMALSLGLVGALSIVRFRAAVREQEELAYLFLAIAIGLCLGADQQFLALLAFGLTSIALIGKSYLTRKTRHENLYLKLGLNSDSKGLLEQVSDILNRHCAMVKLKRSEFTSGETEMSFQVEFRNVGQLINLQRDVTDNLPAIHMSVIDGEGLA